MTYSSEQDRHARQFLLGELEEHERQQLEKRLMVNAEYQEQMLLAEETLIEDYLNGILPAEQRKEFENNFLASNLQSRRVRVLRLLANYETRKGPNSDQPQPTPSGTRRWSIGFGNRTRAVVFTCLVAASLLIIGLAVSQIFQNRRETQRAGIERELAQLNSTPELTVSPFVVVLAPVSLRDTNDSATLAIPLTAEVVEIRLVIGGQNVNTNYAAELTRTGTAEIFNVDGLRAQSTANGQAVVVRFPSRLLNRGDYRLSLIRIANDGRKTVIGEYLFAVGS
ncbi:MAG TPA: hypothetical protein VJR02_23590 [Pyrinomonadaceae bacterium]|nr:hypothetical protein [Pyrinomonadaceae bacterium]